MQSRIWAAALGTAAVLAGLPALGQVVARKSASFAIVGQNVRGEAVLTAKANGTLVKLDARPLAAVTLAETISPGLAAQFGAKPDHQFDAGRRLYGWPERPELYCDLLRHRGLGLSTACLRDNNLDGRFDEGLRLDFTSGSGDLLVVNTANKIIGVRYQGKPVPLPTPVTYVPAAVPDEITGKLALKWRHAKTAGGAPAAELWISTPDNYTGTEGLSENVLRFARDRAPLDLEIYGINLRILGFDEKGAMRYQLQAVRDGAIVPLFFRGYTFRILIL